MALIHDILPRYQWFLFFASQATLALNPADNIDGRVERQVKFMFAIIGILGCVFIAAAVVTAAAAAVGTGYAIKNGQDQLDAAKDAARSRKNFEDKQLRLHKADKVRQELINRQQLRKARGQVMSSVALQEIAMRRDAKEAGRLRRENAMNAVGLDTSGTNNPRAGYGNGNPVRS